MCEETTEKKTKECATDPGGYHDLLDRSLGHKEGKLCNTISRSAHLSLERICTRDKRGARETYPDCHPTYSQAPKSAIVTRLLHALLSKKGGKESLFNLCQKKKSTLASTHHENTGILCRKFILVASSSCTLSPCYTGWTWWTRRWVHLLSFL